MTDQNDTSILTFMMGDHRRCDDLYAEGEGAAVEGNMDSAKELLGSFANALEKHLNMEENIFFPAFTEATGMTAGPVQVMLMEHQQMRDVLSTMREAIDAGDKEQILGAGETLVILMQQHNIKEEGILYPMIDQHLSGNAAALIERAKNI